MSQYIWIFQNMLDIVMGSTLVKCAATDLAIQWVGWAVAAALKTEKFYDLAGNLAYLKLSWYRMSSLLKVSEDENYIILSIAIISLSGLS